MVLQGRERADWPGGDAITKWLASWGTVNDVTPSIAWTAEMQKGAAALGGQP